MLEHLDKNTGLMIYVVQTIFIIYDAKTMKLIKKFTNSFFVFLVLAIMLVEGCSSSPPTAVGNPGEAIFSESSLIVGGSDASPSSYPFMVSLQRVGVGSAAEKHLCGGTLVDGNSVLTSAGCVDEFSEVGADPSSLQVLVSTYQLSAASADNLITVSSIEIIPDWQPGGFAEGPDVAILQLLPETQEQVDLLNGLPKVSLVPSRSDTEIGVIVIDTSSVRPGLTGTTIGWGGLSDPIPGPPAEIPVSDTLQEIRLAILNQNVCEEIGGEISPNILCAGKREGRGICFGDQGGPLFVRGEQAGISSFVFSPDGGCIEEGYSGFTRLTQREISDFIESTSVANGGLAQLIPTEIPSIDLELIEVTPEAIQISSPSLNIDIVSSTQSGDSVLVSFSLGDNRDLDVEIDYSTGSFSFISVDSPITLSISDKVNLVSVLQSPGFKDVLLTVNSGVLIGESLVGLSLQNSLNYLVEAPLDFTIGSSSVGETSERQLSRQGNPVSLTGGDGSIQLLCESLGDTATGEFTLDSLEPGVTRTVMGIVGPCQEEPCLGRCGAGCSGTSLGDYYTQDCFDHDLCNRAARPTGSALDDILRALENINVFVGGADCDDEFAAAADDFILASECPECDGRCDEQQVSGGTEGDLRTLKILEEPILSMSPVPVSFSVTYNMFSIPDQLDIFFNGQLVGTTGGLVSGSDSLGVDVLASPNVISSPPSTGFVDPSATIRVVGNSDPGTAWNYILSCSDN